MKKLSDFDSSYPSLIESKISDEELSVLRGGEGSCSQGCKKQCITQKKTQKIVSECVVIKSISFEVTPIPIDDPIDDGRILEPSSLISHM